jgi:hypothetical protein
MAEPHILSTLRRKRDDIQAAIESYEAKIEAANNDLAAVKRLSLCPRPYLRGVNAAA